jgi:hypothetical protein
MTKNETKTKKIIVKGKNKSAPPPAPCQPFWG